MSSTATNTSGLTSFFHTDQTQSFHCIGVGGIGVSGLAECLLKAGHSVSGSDDVHSDRTAYLAEQGVAVTIGHDVRCIDRADCVIYSRAVAADHPEMLAAREKGIPCYSRGECLAFLLKGQRSLVVAGSHGKSTTAGWLAYALQQGGIPIDKYLGALIQGESSTISFSGDKAYPCVLESDESDGSCFLLSPTVLIITNIDADHLEHYEDSLSVLQDRFSEWIAQIPAEGCVIVCRDDPGVVSILPQISKTVRVITYGFHPESDYRLLDCVNKGCHFVWRWCAPNGVTQQANALLPGRHNGLNGLAAWIACEYWVKGSALSWQKAWSDYPGVNRRMTIHGTHTLPAGEALIIEDYGHHPTELQVTLCSIQETWPDRRVVVVFQPHRYSRTQALFDDFVSVLASVACLHLLPIYSANERDDCGVSSQRLADAIAAKTGVKPVMHATLEGVCNVLQSILMPDDIVLLQGAGTVGTLAKALCVSVKRAES